MTFDDEIQERLKAAENNQSLKKAARSFLEETIDARYSYNFKWLGRPIIQYPQDMVAMQEILWEVKPDLVIETGIAHGGSLIFSASMLALNAACGGPAEAGVLGIDIEIRPHNRKAIEDHPLSSRIKMLEGSSVAADIAEQVKEIAAKKSRILVCLDSNHSHEHVFKELKTYCPLVSVGSYCVVFDTVVEDLPAHVCDGRPWGPGDNAKTAVRKFLENNGDFVVDRSIESKLQVSVAPDGYLRRIK